MHDEKPIRGTDANIQPIDRTEEGDRHDYHIGIYQNVHHTD